MFIHFKPAFHCPLYYKLTLDMSYCHATLCFLGGKYTKDDFKAYEKDVENRSKLALKDQVNPKQEYPCVSIIWDFIFQFFHLVS